MRILRVYLLDTWKLCAYADPSLEKVEFLFDKLHADFFRLTDSFLKYTDRTCRFEGDELTVMDEILNVLMEKLEKWIKDHHLNAPIS